MHLWRQHKDSFPLSKVRREEKILKLNTSSLVCDVCGPKTSRTQTIFLSLNILMFP